MLARSLGALEDTGATVRPSAVSGSEGLGSGSSGTRSWDHHSSLCGFLRGSKQVLQGTSVVVESGCNPL